MKRPHVLFLSVALSLTYFLLSMRGVISDATPPPTPGGTVVSFRHYHKKVGYIKLALILRTYQGHARKFFRYLQHTLFRFLDRSKYPITIVLDEEGVKDRDFGNFLQNHSYIVKYEKKPSSRVLDTRPFREYENMRGVMHTEGYTRQLYSTFFFDNYTDADIIGIIDADMNFLTVLTLESILDEYGRLFKGALVGDMYPGNSLALKEESLYDFMGTDAMPQFFYRNTFINFRNHITKLFGGISFDDAWMQFAKTRLSPVNVISNYAVKYEPEKYRLVLPNDTEGMIVPASNRPSSWLLWRTGCCHTFGEAFPGGVYKPSQKLKDLCVNRTNDNSHVLHFNSVDRDNRNGGLTEVAWQGNTALREAHYRNVRNIMFNVSITSRELMREMAKNCAS